MFYDDIWKKENETMLDAILVIKDELLSMLNPSAFTTDSLEGWLVILIVVYLAYRIFKEGVKLVNWLISAILFVQVCYYFGHTGLNSVIPFSEFFKYDVLTAVAQCFVGTKLCDVILFLSSSMQYGCNEIARIITAFI